MPRPLFFAGEEIMRGYATLVSRQKFSVKPVVFSDLFSGFWWVVLFILINFLVFHFIIKDLRVKEKDLGSKVTSLIELKREVLAEKENLEMQMKSREDPLWIEMILKKELGLISEGQIKVHFFNK